MSARIADGAGFRHGFVIARYAQKIWGLLVPDWLFFGYRLVMTALPDLRTDRLNLRPPAVEDRAFGERLHRDPVVRRYLGGPTPEERLPDVLGDYVAFGPRRAAWIVRVDTDAEPIGLVTLSEHKDGRDVELSYQFLPNAWGRGYASEATRAVIDHAMRAMHLPAVIAETQTANAPSLRLLERLGMTRRALLRRFGEEQVIYELPLLGPEAKRPNR